MAEAKTRLLSPELVAQLARFRLGAKRRVSGRYSGAHRSRRHGASLDFADYREYVVGDDPRRVDLSAYRRLGRLLVKLYEAEDEAAVRIVVDLSASMGFGAKLDAARAITAAFAALAAGGQDRVRVLLAGGEHQQPGLRSRLASGDIAATGEAAPVAAAHTSRAGRGVSAGPWFRGPSALFAVEDRLLRADADRAIDADGSTTQPVDLVPALRQAGGEGPVGPVVLVSDLLFEGWSAALEALAANRGDALLVHVLGREDLDPSIRGDVRLVDSESGGDVEVGIADKSLDGYIQARDAWLAEVLATCGRHGITYARLIDDEEVDALVMGTLRELGVVA